MDLARNLLANAIEKHPEANICASPRSAIRLLELLRKGAAGETLARIQDLLAGEQKSQPCFALTETTGTWVSSRLQIEPSFRESFPDVASLDFTNPTEAKKLIDGFVREGTKGKISEIPVTLDKSTELVAMSVLHFKDGWYKDYFRKENTRDEEFTLPSHATVRVPMMHTWIPSHYLHASGYRAVGFHLQGATFIAIRPTGRTTIRHLADRITQDVYRQILHSEEPHGLLKVALPKFSVQSTLELPELGSDFSGIARGLCHEPTYGQVSKFTIDEEGCEGAAVSYGVEFTGGSLYSDELPPLIFDRPFIWALVADFSGEVIFNGVVNNPLDSGE